jgi:hypothetical protein
MAALTAVAAAARVARCDTVLDFSACFAMSWHPQVDERSVARSRCQKPKSAAAGKLG